MNLERYIKKIDSLKASDIKLLRESLRNKFKKIQKYDDLALIFEPLNQQEKLLLKLMLKCIINEINTHIDKIDEIVSSISNFLIKIPNDPKKVPLISDVELKKIKGINSLLIQLGLKLFDYIKQILNPEEASKIYERAYKQVSSQFITLDAFPIVISLLPYESLDHSKISLLNINQSHRILQEKIQELQENNQKILEKNQKLEKTQKKLIKSKEEAQKANQLKSQLLANVSHELRTPMSSILGFSELLMSGIVPEEKIVEFASQINKNGERLLNLINNFLDLSKIESGKALLDKSWFSLTDLCILVRSYTEEMIDTKPIDLKITYDESLNRDIYADKDKLLQILFNITSNAAKYTISGNIDIDCKLVKGFLEITIADSGIGIEPHDLNHIFEEFYQIHTGLVDARGSGLGLSISKHLVELMGGQIKLESKIGIGSRCSFTINISETFTKKVQKAKTKKTIKSINPDQIIGRQKGPILIAEDESSVRYLLKNILDGFDIEFVRNGIEAIESVTVRKPQLIILDIMMPEMNGEETMKYFRDIEDYAETPIIALTAKAMTGEKEKLLEMGFTDYLSKPVKKADLLAKLDKYV